MPAQKCSQCDTPLPPGAPRCARCGTYVPGAAVAPPTGTVPRAPAAAPPQAWTAPPMGQGQPAAAYAPAAGDRFAQDKFLLNQKVLSLGNKYYVYDQAQQPLFFVDRPVLKIKRNFGIYEDDSKSRQLLALEQASALSLINFEFTLKDAAGQPLARFQRHGWTSIVRRTWKIYDPRGQEIAHAYEDSLWKAVLRRALEMTDNLGGLIRTNFIIVRPDGTHLGDYIRRFTLTDKYVMDLTADPQRTLDRRIAVGLAILLDNVESR